MTARVCVVVSAYNRRNLLRVLVESLRSQELADFEAVIVDNGSDDDSHARLLELTRNDDRFRILRLETNAGPARARNLAWQGSSAPLVAFTDDDCAPDPRWLEGLTRAAASADIVQGRTVPQESEQPPGWFDRSPTIERWSGRFQTCNLLVRRSVLERTGGFREGFQIAMGEDTDLGVRAVSAGATTAFAPDAVVRHHVWKGGFRQFLRERRRYAEVVELMKVTPAARSVLHGRLVIRVAHLVILGLVPAAVLGVILGAPWLPLALATGWIGVTTWRTRRRDFSWPRRFAYCCLQFTAYAYELGCFLAASVRYRTLVI